MKQIKFKGWHKKLNIMFKVDVIDFSGGTIRKGDPVVIDDSTNGGCYLLKNIILIRYTGRKTKNGKEIYEGNIFDTYCGDPFVNPSTVVWSDKACSFYVSIEYDSDYDMCINTCIENDYPMIGNIFENPELLKC